jgi:hypothetical protein
MQTEDQSGASQVITRNKAYSSCGTRAMLRFRGIRAVIPEPEISSHRRNRGAASGCGASMDAR